MLLVRKARAVTWLEESIADADHIMRFGDDAVAITQWMNVTRYALRETFGPGSDALVAFDRACQGLDIGAFESQDVKQKRHASMVALVALLRDLLADDVAKAPDDVPVPKPTSAAERHYAILGVLYNLQDEHAGQAWHVGPGYKFDTTGLNDDEQYKSLEMLAFRGLAKRAGQKMYTLTATGHAAYVDRVRFDSIFPSLTPAAHSPATPTHDTTKVEKIVSDLVFVREGKLRTRVVADLAELSRAVKSGLYKTQMILCGSILESVLFDIFDRRPDLAKSVHKEDYPRKWSLRHYLEAAEMPLGKNTEAFLSESAKDFGKRVTDHRDLVHAYAYVSRDVTIDDASADMMLSLLALVVRDLRRSHDDGRLATFETS